VSWAIRRPSVANDMGELLMRFPHGAEAGFLVGEDDDDGGGGDGDGDGDGDGEGEYGRRQ
jgi:hypothetical protein